MTRASLNRALCTSPITGTGYEDESSSVKIALPDTVGLHKASSVLFTPS